MNILAKIKEVIWTISKEIKPIKAKKKSAKNITKKKKKKTSKK